MNRSSAFAWRHARWRGVLAAYALVAFAWPSLGPLPWLVVHDAAPAVHAHAHHHDASDVPGSPTHPADHDCTPCQLLKHLARCAPLPPPLATVALHAAAPSPSSPRFEAQRATAVAALPPVRAPPSLAA